MMLTTIFIQLHAALLFGSLSFSFTLGEGGVCLVSGTRRQITAGMWEVGMASTCNLGCYKIQLPLLRYFVNNE
jgi:hypothetical protein